MVVRGKTPRKGKSYWLCECSCGNTAEVAGDKLLRGSTKSCGCNRGKALPPGVAAKNRLLRQYVRNAKERSLPWELGDDHFFLLTQSPCHYCGSPPRRSKQPTSGQHALRTGTYVYNGVDRLNNAQGYRPDNVVPCCIYCNRAKNNETLAEFEGWLDRLASFRASRG